MPATYVGSSDAPRSDAPRYMFALWHCVSGSHQSPNEDHRLPKGLSGQAFKRYGLTRVIKSCINAASAFSSDATKPPFTAVVLGDTNIKTTAQFAAAIEETQLERGGSWVGKENDFIWSTCELASLSNIDFTYSFEPAHSPVLCELGTFHRDHVPEARATPDIRVGRDASEAALEVEADILRRLQQDWAINYNDSEEG